MKIFIPSSGRVFKQTTLNNLPPRVHEKYRVTLVVPQEEENDYKMQWGGAVNIAAPDIPRGIGPARQWCVEHTDTSDKVLMLDDDLVWAGRRTDDPTKFQDAAENELMYLLSHVEEELSYFASVGVSTREGGNRDTSRSSLNTRLLRALAYRTDILEKEDIRFDQIEVMEDFYVALSLLTRGYENLKLNYMVHNQGGSDTSGGCSQYRTKEVQAAAAHALHDRFPDFVKVVEKETKTAWGGGVRTDVTIQWKKALKSAGEIREV